MSTQEGQLLGFYATSPLGPWLQHARNPLAPSAPRGTSVAGRLIKWQDKLYRFGRNHEVQRDYRRGEMPMRCFFLLLPHQRWPFGQVGHDAQCAPCIPMFFGCCPTQCSLVAFSIQELSPTTFVERFEDVSFGRRRGWNKERFHHVELQQVRGYWTNRCTSLTCAAVC